MITTLIFDWGGVLALADAKSTAKKLAPLYGCDEEFLKKRISFWEAQCSEGPDYALFLSKIEEEFGISSQVIIDCLTDTPPNEIYRWAKTLQKKYTLIVLSNQMKFKTDHIRAHFDLSFFDAVFFSNEIGMQKPSAKAFILMLEKIKKKPEECLFIDDNRENVQGAEKYGLQVVHCKDVKQLREELLKRGI